MAAGRGGGRSGGVARGRAGGGTRGPGRPRALLRAARRRRSPPGPRRRPPTPLRPLPGAPVAGRAVRRPARGAGARFRDPGGGPVPLPHALRGRGPRRSRRRPAGRRRTGHRRVPGRPPRRPRHPGRTPLPARPRPGVPRLRAARAGQRRGGCPHPAARAQAAARWLPGAGHRGVRAARRAVRQPRVRLPRPLRRPGRLLHVHLRHHRLLLHALGTVSARDVLGRARRHVRRERPHRGAGGTGAVRGHAVPRQTRPGARQSARAARRGPGRRGPPRQRPVLRRLPPGQPPRPALHPRPGDPLGARLVAPRLPHRPGPRSAHLLPRAGPGEPVRAGEAPTAAPPGERWRRPPTSG
ncbi:hypothetical protein SGRI78S_05780 [Streptomyces griseus subsp. griseus]